MDVAAWLVAVGTFLFTMGGLWLRAKEIGRFKEGLVPSKPWLNGVSIFILIAALWALGVLIINVFGSL